MKIFFCKFTNEHPQMPIKPLFETQNTTTVLAWREIFKTSFI